MLIAFCGSPVAPAAAADIDFWSLRARLPAHSGWTLLAGVGLLGVAVAALTVRRSRKQDDVPDHAPLSKRAVETQPAVAVPVADAPPAFVAAEPVPIDVAPPQPATSVPPEPAVFAPTPADGSPAFLALHHVDLSIEVLHRHLQREPRPMPAVWLMLLDLCRTHGREQRFSELALEFHRRFNVCAPGWEGYPPNRDEPGLEAFPRLVKEVTLTWGTQECTRLLDRLLYDNRGGNRNGFSVNAYNDLIALRRAADAVLETIELDLAEEAKVRSAYASASAEIAMDHGGAATTSLPRLAQEPESERNSVARADGVLQCALEREYPALATMVAREWGNAALSARLCEMLSRGGDGVHPLSKEAAEEMELLRQMAERIAAANGIELFPGDTD